MSEGGECARRGAGVLRAARARQFAIWRDCISITTRTALALEKCWQNLGKAKKRRVITTSSRPVLMFDSGADCGDRARDWRGVGWSGEGVRGESKGNPKEVRMGPKRVPSVPLPGPLRAAPAANPLPPQRKHIIFPAARPRALHAVRDRGGPMRRLTDVQEISE